LSEVECCYVEVEHVDQAAVVHVAVGNVVRVASHGPEAQSDLLQVEHVHEAASVHVPRDADVDDAVSVVVVCRACLAWNLPIVRIQARVNDYALDVSELLFERLFCRDVFLGIKVNIYRSCAV
jgi:hypothetical protein